jgi:hypothetical protein
MLSRILERVALELRGDTDDNRKRGSDPSQYDSYSLYVLLLRCLSMDGMVLRSKARERGRRG